MRAHVHPSASRNSSLSLLALGPLGGCPVERVSANVFKVKLSFLLFENRSVMLDRAENLLHDHYGGKEYWDVSAACGLAACSPAF